MRISLLLDEVAGSFRLLKYLRAHRLLPPWMLRVSENISGLRGLRTELRAKSNSHPAAMQWQLPYGCHTDQHAQ